MALESTSLFLLGLGLQVLSNLLASIGLLLQKLSADVEKGRPVWRRWRFWLGFASNVGAQAVFKNLAILLLPLSVIAPSAGLSIVFNAILAHLGCVPGVKERLGLVEWAATALIMGSVGAVAVAGSAHGEEDTDVVGTLSEAFQQPGFIVFACSSSCLVFLWIFLFEQRCVPCLLRYRPAENSRLAVVGTGLAAALAGAFAVTCLKGANAAFFDWIAGGSPFPRPLAWGWLGLIACAMPLQFYLLNLMFRNGSATFANPLFLSFMTVLSSMSGGFLFSEYEALLRREPAGVWVAVYVGAIILVLVGLGILSWQQDAKAMGSTRGFKSIDSAHAPVEEPVTPEGDVEVVKKRACYACCWL